MSRPKLKDMIIILPGILGSVLQKNGKDVWAPSFQAVGQLLQTGFSSLHELALQDDDPELEFLDDGVRAARIFQDVHLIPGFYKIDGYTGLGEILKAHFANVIEGSLEHGQPANYFEFPYDWRRDNRAAAHKLKRLIDKRLPIWREYSGADDAQVILIGHSMGGLVSSYYLEVLQGWSNCRALITFGTPFAGAPQALGYLVNGYKQLFVDLSNLLRSLTSAYQILPMYKMIQTEAGLKRAVDIDNLPNLSLERIRNGRRFFEEIQEAAVANRQQPHWQQNPYQLIPIVGTKQATTLSATWANGRLTVSNQAFDQAQINQGLADGDGTVPRLSAIPPSFLGDYQEAFVFDRHSTMQNNLQTLAALVERINHLQNPELNTLLEFESWSGKGIPLSLEIDDAYMENEPVAVSISPANAEPITLDAVTAEVASVAQPTIRQEVPLRSHGPTWQVTLTNLQPGAYRLGVAGRVGDQIVTHPLEEIFVITPAST